jgi:muramidase (phage lysozyme)
MGILDDWDSMDVDFGPQSGSSSFGGGFSDDILFGGSGGDMLKPDAGLELLTQQERTQLTWDEQRRLIAERSAKIAAENGGGDSVKNPLAEVVAAPPSQPNYMSSETGQSISPNDPRLRTPEFDRVFGQQQQPEQFGPAVPSQSPNPMLDLANNPSLGQPQQPVDRKHPFLDLIGQAEGTDKGRGYNETLGYGKFTGGPVDLTNMTVNQVLDLQKQMLAHPENSFNSSAAGRYQIVGKTLRGLVDAGVVNGNDMFNEGTQDKAALFLMQQRGANPSGLRNEWEGLRRVSPEAMLAAYGGAEVPAITRVADASGRFAPGVAPGSMPGPRTPGPRTQGSPRMDGTQTPSDEDRIQAALRAYGGGNGGGGGMLGGLGGLLGGGGGGGSDNSAMMRAIGLSLLSSPRQAPLQNLAQNLALAEKQGESAQTEKAAGAMAAYLGIDPRLAPIVAKNPQLLQMILQDRTQKENSRLLGSDPFLTPNAIPGQQSQVQPPAQQAPAEPIASSVGAPTDRSASLKPDVVGTPAGYDWRTGAVAESTPPPAEPPAQSALQAPQEIAPFQVAAGKGGGGGLSIPMPTQALDTRPIPKTPATQAVTSELQSRGYRIPATPEEAYGYAIEFGKRLTAYEARGMKVDALKPILESYLKLAVPTDKQREIAAAYKGDPAGAQRALRNSIDDKRPGDIQTFEYSEENPKFIPYQKQLAEAKSTRLTNNNNIDQKQETAYDAKMGGQFADMNKEIMDGARSATGKIAALDRIGTLLKDPGVYTGAGGEKVLELKRIAKNLGFDVAGVPETETIQAISNQFALELRNPSGGAGMPGAMSEKDREFLQAMSPGNLSKTKEGSQLLIDYNKRLAERAIEVEQTRRDYVKKNKRLDEGFYQVLADKFESKRLFSDEDAKEAARALSDGNASPGQRSEKSESNTNIPRLKDNKTGEAIYKRLKPGDQFYDENGNLRTKGGQ